jgi:hypothetical protein
MAEPKSFIDRLEDDGEEFAVGFKFASCKVCQTCMFKLKDGLSHIYLDGKDHGYQNSHCQIYEADDLGNKPHEVAFDGASCEYYEAET